MADSSEHPRFHFSPIFQKKNTPFRFQLLLSDQIHNQRGKRKRLVSGSSLFSKPELEACPQTDESSSIHRHTSTTFRKTSTKNRKKPPRHTPPIHILPLPPFPPEPPNAIIFPPPSSSPPKLPLQPQVFEDITIASENISLLDCRLHRELVDCNSWGGRGSWSDCVVCYYLFCWVLGEVLGGGDGMGWNGAVEIVALERWACEVINNHY